MTGYDDEVCGNNHVSICSISLCIAYIECGIVDLFLLANPFSWQKVYGSFVLDFELLQKTSSVYDTFTFCSDNCFLFVCLFAVFLHKNETIRSKS